ncbi:MAG: Amino acid permease [Chthonomonadales bacterium]|nr:Amino acid permease [Chthonomonadales bacterium]
MSLLDALLGKSLASQEEAEHKVGVFEGVPMLGLDALGSSAYGPEAALTLLLPLGALGLHYIDRIKKVYPDRLIAVLIPELVEPRWYHYLLHNHAASVLKAALLVRGGRQVVVMNVPWYLREEAAETPDAGTHERSSETNTADGPAPEGAKEAV